MTPLIPLNVPPAMRSEYYKNADQAKNMTGRTFMLACDQLLEHAYSDFLPEVNASKRADPEYLFELGHLLQPELFAVPVGLIARYAHEYQDLPYIAKLTGKTNICPSDSPLSAQLFSIEQVIELAKSNVRIIGVGTTVYLGNQHEGIMLRQAVENTQKAHKAGLLSVVWMYARGSCIDSDRAGKLVADCAAVGANVGADYLKIKAPQADQQQSSTEWLERAVRIAGNTKLLISGGPKSNEQQLLENIQSWIQVGATGVAIGRNIFQRPMDQAKDLYEKIQQLLMTP